MIFLYWIREIKNFFVSFSSPYKYRKKLPKRRTDVLCEDTIHLEYERDLITAHANVPKKTKRQLIVEFVLRIVFILFTHGFLIYLFRKK
jgi:hypothetical protein